MLIEIDESETFIGNLFSENPIFFGASAGVGKKNPEPVQKKVRVTNSNEDFQYFAYFHPILKLPGL